MLFRRLANFRIGLSPEAVVNRIHDIKYSVEKPEGVNTVVVVASIHGYFLASEVGPCFDIRSYNEAVSSHNATAQCHAAAISKLREYMTIEMTTRLNDFEGTDEEFMEKYKDLYTFTPNEKPPVYKNFNFREHRT